MEVAEAAPTASGHRSCAAADWKYSPVQLRWLTRDRQRTQWLAPPAQALRIAWQAQRYSRMGLGMDRQEDVSVAYMFLLCSLHG
jgi:hypothetical protein